MHALSGSLVLFPSLHLTTLCFSLFLFCLPLTPTCTHHTLPHAHITPFPLHMCTHTPSLFPCLPPPPPLPPPPHTHTHREILQEIAQFEQAELSSSSSSRQQTTPSHKRAQLEPLNYAAGEKLLHMVCCVTFALISDLLHVRSIRPAPLMLHC